jgi:DNA topoisomerase VI subunit B
MNKEEFERAIAEVAERLELYLEQQVDARLEAEEEQQQS